MSNVLKRYPAPWRVVEMTVGASIEAANGNTVIIMGKRLFIADLLEFIVETVNNSIRSRITDQPCTCSCGWQGTVWDCEPDVDGDGSLGCPECMKVIENI